MCVCIYVCVCVLIIVIFQTNYGTWLFTSGHMDYIGFVESDLGLDLRDGFIYNAHANLVCQQLFCYKFKIYHK